MQFNKFHILLSEFILRHSEERKVGSIWTLRGSFLVIYRILLSLSTGCNILGVRPAPPQ